jgi:carboxypeptidase PM20D1
MRPVMRLAKRLAALLLVLFAALAAVLVTRAVRLRPPRIEAQTAPVLKLDRAALAERLGAAIRRATISWPERTKVPEAEFLALHDDLERFFPRVHERLSRERAGGSPSPLSLLYTWHGKDSALAPVLFAAHLDVVPIEPGTESRWTEPPFSGRLARGAVFGRGALDDKMSALGILEAAESLLAEGFAPRRTLLFAFGHDEEVGGAEGAARIAALLAARGVRPAWVLDEGLLVARGMIPGLAAPVALVGIAEKGFVTVELVATADGGHASMPPPQTAAGIVAAAAARLEASPFPARFEQAQRLLESIAPKMPFSRRLVLANLWLFSPLVEHELARRPATNALLRTTTAVTMLEGGPKENVLPSRARAVANLRILPGESVAGTIERVRRTIADPRVEVRAIGDASEPSRESRTDSDGWRALEATIREIFPGAIVAPSLVIGATDSRHYAGIAEDVYRFLPIEAGPEDLRRVHGTDEAVRIEDYERAVAFYRRLIERAGR